MKCTLSLGALILVVSTFSWAALNGVEDSGWTSTSPHHRILNAPPERTSTKATPLPLVPLNPYSEADMLPVKSERLSPGKVENRVTNTPGLAPIFLIGDDDLSRRWLTSRKEVLQQLKAVGLVVNVQRLGALTELRNLGEGLAMVPASADELAEHLGIQHYPLLITASGIEQ
ncbi:integrating conjugative element protein [Pseudomonas fluorescens]|nr:integrating conjugative element protein [Pseudomonas fluorescens]